MPFLLFFDKDFAYPRTRNIYLKISYRSQNSNNAGGQPEKRTMDLTNRPGISVSGRINTAVSVRIAAYFVSVQTAKCRACPVGGVKNAV
jgi:hypothetical protein